MNCYVRNEALKKAKGDFEKARGKSKEFWEKGFKREEQYIVLDALCKIVEVIVGINDYEAACLAYLYTIPKIERYIVYLSSVISGNKVYKSIRSGEYVKYFDDRYVERYREITVEDRGDKERVRRWADGSDKRTIVDDGIGGKTEYCRFDYIYQYLYERQMAIAAKYFIHYNMRYLELDKSKRAYPRREKVLAGAIWWSNQMMLKKFGLSMPDCEGNYDYAPRVIIFSTFPSSGKSFLNNTVNEMFSCLSREITGRGGVLRISNEQGNIERQSKQTMDLISNPLLLEIYPEMKAYVKKDGKYDPFMKKTMEEWALNGCQYSPYTSIFKTRDSAINSIRCELGIFDDPSRGMQECDNVDIHQAITLKYNTDFMDRFDDPEEIAVMLTGTMFNPFDVFSTEIQRVFDAGGVVRDKRFRSDVFISGDKRTVIILNDVQNDDGTSKFPEYISDAMVEKKRESIPSYEYHCIWRQKPIPAEGLVFSKEYLNFYDKLPENLSDYSFAAIDPTRKKASDFFAMPIFKLNFDDGKYYLVDVIFERKSTIELYPKIIEKIVNNKIVKLIYEENIDKSLGIALKDKLKIENFPYCEMVAEYSKANKQARIMHLSDTIKQWIVFPSNAYAKSTTTMGLAVNQLMEYDGEKSRHDDFPDALAMFANLHIVNGDRKNKVTTSNEMPW